MLKREIKRIEYSHRFLKSFQKLPVKIQRLAKKKETIFIVNLFDSRLKTHKLKGEFQNYWAYSINRSYRILFCFLNKNKALYYDIGTHEIYK